MIYKPQIIVKDNPTQLARAGAEILCFDTIETLKKSSLFYVAISGGSTPRAMHQLMAREPYLSAIPWDRLHVFWVDERCVPVDDKASNYGIASKDLFDNVPIPGAHVHPMPGGISPGCASIIFLKRFLRVTFPVIPNFSANSFMLFSKS